MYFTFSSLDCFAGAFFNVIISIVVISIVVVSIVFVAIVVVVCTFALLVIDSSSLPRCDVAIFEIGPKIAPGMTLT